jgi:hypothetical protein
MQRVFEVWIVGEDPTIPVSDFNKGDDGGYLNPIVQLVYLAFVAGHNLK